MGGDAREGAAARRRKPTDSPAALVPAAALAAAPAVAGATEAMRPTATAGPARRAAVFTVTVWG